MKKTLLLILGLVLTTSLFAGPVGKEEAKEKALAFLNGNDGTKDGVAKAPRHQQDLSLATTGDAYHVFNIGAGNGFVIVSGSDLTPDIIGYTDEGSFNPQSLPDNMKAWLQGYADQIEWVEKNGEPAASESVMRKAPADVKAPIAPLIKTKWDQIAPYNYLTPYCKWNGSAYEYRNDYDTDYEHCATGCVATAMAQVMYYGYKKEGFPVGTTKDIPSYTKNHTLPACPQIASFDWSNMKETYTGTESTSDPQATAVAKLMLYCGAAVEMKYSASSNTSSDYIPKALREYFGYDERVQHCERVKYTVKDWEELIYRELSSLRPVLYSGQSTDGGHAFICDGYSEDGYFHINWGWGGNGNGYYLLNVANPELVAVGSGNSADGYSMRQSITIGLEKPVGSFSPEEGRMTVEKFDYTGSATVARGSSVTVPCNIELHSYLSVTCDLEYAFVIYNASNSMAGIYGYYSCNSLAPNAYIFGSKTPMFNLTKSALPNGSYTLKLVSRFKGDTDWLPCSGTENYYFKLDADDDNVTITQSKPTFVVSDVVISECVVGSKTKMTATVKSTGVGYNGDLYLFVQGFSKPVAGNGVSIEEGKKANAIFDFILPSGGGSVKDIKMATDINCDNVIWSGSITVKSGAVADDTPTLTSNHSLNLDGTNTYILGTKLVDKVTLTNTSTTKPYAGYVDLRVYTWTKSGSDWLRSGVGGSPQWVEIPANSTVNLTFERDGIIVSSNKKYSVLTRYYHNGGAWDSATPGTEDTPYFAKDAIVCQTVDGTNTYIETAPSMTIPETVKVNGVDKVVAVVDLRGQSVVTDIHPNSNKNCLYLLDTSASVPTGISDNVVKGTTAENIVLTDGYDFYSPIDFTAKKISYKRIFDNGASLTGGGWNTIVLPFDVSAVKVGGSAIDWFKSSTDSGKNFWMFAFSGGAIDAVDFDYTTTFNANTPYLINVPGTEWGENSLVGKEITFEGTDNFFVEAGENNAQSGVYYIFKGGSISTSVKDAYVMNLGGTKFVETTGEVDPFRAYFYPSTYNKLSSSLIIRLVNNNEVEATGIGSVESVQESADEAWYTINGVKLTGKPTEKGVYIKGGRKYIIQ